MQFSATRNDLKVETCHRRYTVEIDLAALYEWERKALHECEEGEADKPPKDKPISEQLDEIPGLFATDYNGHLGAVVFLNIEDEHDTESTWLKIKEILKPFLPKAR